MTEFEIKKEIYDYRYKNSDRMIAKNVILTLCLIALAVVIIGVVACLGNGSYFDLIYYSAAFAVIILIQFSCIFLCYELIIEFNCGRLKVVKSYSGICKTVFETDCRNIKIERYSDSNNYGKIVALYSKGCVASRYVIELSGRKYLLNLDDYMYSLIEVARDLS